MSNLSFPAFGRCISAMLGAALILLLVPMCSAPTDDEGTPRRTARQVDQLFTTIAQTELVHDPELATRLGLSESRVGYPFSARLTDRSQAAFERLRVTRLETLEALARLPHPAEGSNLARDLDVVMDAYQTAESLFVKGHGETGLGVSYPYVADHMRGAHVDVPELLLRHHKVNSAADAEAYVLRATQWASTLEDERRRLQADAAAGIIPPDVILSRMEGLAATIGTGPAEQHPIVVTLDNLMQGVDGLDEDTRVKLYDKLVSVIRDEVLPAYTRYRASLNALRSKAPDDVGMWRLPQGDAYYDAALAAYTDRNLHAETLHALGQQEVERLTGELDIALAASGLTEGTVSERLVILSTMPEQMYEDSPEGREALLNRLRGFLAKAEAAIGPQLPTPIKSSVSIRAVSDALEQSSPAAFYNAATADGSAPGIFEINLTSMTDWPDFTLATLVYHETLPGHHLESAYTSERLRLPLVRQMTWNVAYGEGWGAYAETLADEMGLYDDDPLGRIGYLQSMLFRAARLVADTGIHREHWRRDEAIDYLVRVTGQPVDAMTAEVDRYAVWPGQAAAYWVGRQKFLDLRDRARKVLGPKFDQAQFHNVILSGGPRPLNLVERDIERWYSAQIKD